MPPTRERDDSEEQMRSALKIPHLPPNASSGREPVEARAAALEAAVADHRAFRVSLDLPLTSFLGGAALRERFGLSRQVSRVAPLIAMGCWNAELAAELAISPPTVRRHAERVFEKLGVRSRGELGQRLNASGRTDARDR